jgi:dTDP-4-amino-4,6-dideoxygalactose transaminase
LKIKIPFNKPSIIGLENQYVLDTISEGHIAGGGKYNKLAENLLSKIFSSPALLTTNCTHSLEMCAKLMNFEAGDEVIVPSYTFVSTVNAFTQNGARPVFADIEIDDLNISIASTEKLITKRTKAICIVHYGGAGASPDMFKDLCKESNITLIEDNAHGFGGKYKNQLLGTFGQLSTLSFHETKNVICGEGGATVINDLKYLDRAKILRDKGTNRENFMNGIVDKYTWVDDGSSWALSDILAAFLYGQLEKFDEIFVKRNEIWERYKKGLSKWAESNGVAIPAYSTDVNHTGHLFFLRFSSKNTRDNFINYMKVNGIQTPFHYQALHSTPYAKQYHSNDCPNSSIASETLVRLPIYYTLSVNEQDYIINNVNKFKGFN